MTTTPTNETAPTSTTKENNCSEAYREYRCNSLLVKALLQFLSAQERNKVHEWLQKLDEIGDEMPEAQIRNEYVGYLLLNVKNGRLMTPFNLAPPCGKLRPLSRILPEDLYDDATKQFQMSYCYMKKDEECEEQPLEQQQLNVDPSSFQSEQPLPHRGIIAHCAAFSNYEEKKNDK